MLLLASRVNIHLDTAFISQKKKTIHKIFFPSLNHFNPSQIFASVIIQSLSQYYSLIKSSEWS